VTPRVLPALLVLVALSSCRSAPEPAGPTVGDETTFLGLAVAEAAALEDDASRAGIYALIASGYRELGDRESMLSLAGAALRLARESGQTDESIRLRLSLAPLLAAGGDDASALAALEAGLEYAASSADALLRATILPLVVQSALRSDEPARPVLRRAVDEVYVIEDAGLRAEALIRIAELYQAGGTLLSVTGLIQQAIPAVRSTPDAFRRATLFARLAELALASGEARLGDRLVDIVMSELEDAPALDGEAQSEELLATVSRLAGIGRPSQALAAADLFGSPGPAARALIAIAASSGPGGTRLELLRRAADLAAGIADAATLVEVNAELALGFHRAGTDRLALPYADAAVRGLLANPPVYARVAPAGRVAAALATLDEVQAISDLLAGAPDEYVRGVVAVRAAEQLVLAGRIAVADDFLTVALIASDQASYLADELRREIVGGFAGTGSVRLAIRTVERMDDPLLRARAVAELAVVAEPGGLVTAIHRADLASALSAR